MAEKAGLPALAIIATLLVLVVASSLAGGAGQAIEERTYTYQVTITREIPVPHGGIPLPWGSIAYACKTAKGVYALVNITGNKTLIVFYTMHSDIAGKLREYAARCLEEIIAGGFPSSILVLRKTTTVTPTYTVMSISTTTKTPAVSATPLAASSTTTKTITGARNPPSTATATGKAVPATPSHTTAHGEASSSMIRTWITGPATTRVTSLAPLEEPATRLAIIFSVSVLASLATLVAWRRLGW